MKTCTECNIIKPLEDYYFLNKAKGYRMASCAECRKKYMRERYKNPATRELQRRWWGKEVLYAMKEASPCCDCGNYYPHYVMDWDHRPGEEKLFGLASGSVSLEKRLEEIKKCDLVCANCHRIRTWKGKTIGTR